MADIFLYQGAPNPTDIILRITTSAVLRGAAKSTKSLRYNPKDKREPAFNRKYFDELKVAIKEVEAKADQAMESAQMALRLAAQSAQQVVLSGFAGLLPFEPLVHALESAADATKTRQIIDLSRRAVLLASELQMALDDEEEEEAIMLLMMH